jgi:hypothetical protein
MADIETDYLIIGAGAVGLAFADTLLDEDPDCHITFIDKHAKPGGHWNDAYSFVALHQPSATYGVNSMEFPSEQIDTHGPNKGLFALASGAEVLAYFERVMNKRLLPSGRVAYYPLSEYRGNGRFVSILSGEETTINIRRKTVDATFYQTSVPSTHKRQFSESGNVEVVPPGDLPELWKREGNLPEHYVILGAGKTAMDTGVWLIEAGVDPDHISWIRPRESWLWNRNFTQPGEDFLEKTMSMQIALLKAAKESDDGAELMRKLGDQGFYLRLDPEIEPEMFHYATISPGEVELLRRIRNVIRKGRVTAIEHGGMEFTNGERVEVPSRTLFIDCTATAVPFGASKNLRPIFEGDRITLQPLHVPLVTFSAAMAAFLEANFKSDEERNALAIPGPLTDTPETFPCGYLITMMNRGAWSQNDQISAWLSKSRLDLGGPTITKLIAENSPKLAILGEFQQAIAECMPDVVRIGMKARAIHDAT